MEQMIHVTVAYSNAVLLAVLTHVSDFAKKVELPIPQPITISQVRSFKCHPYTNMVGGVLTLTNGDRFWENGYGYVSVFYGYSNCYFPPDNWRLPEEGYKFTNFWGKMTMTTNEVIEFARNTLRKLGYNPKDMHADGPPTRFDGPYQILDRTIPYCEVEWRNEDKICISINAEKKQIVRLSLISTNAWREPPKIDVTPELESNYRKRTNGQMRTSTNALPRFPSNEHYEKGSISNGS